MAIAGDDQERTRTFTVLAAGVTAGHYRIEGVVGAGGMGEVYRAEDQRLHRRVALKFLPTQLADDNDSKSRFTREAQAVASLNHPNIITVYEVGDFEGRPFMVMELVEGRSLHQFTQDTQLSIERIIDIASQMAQGLEHAHKAGVVHRDIKTANVLVDKDGRARILDFGLATVQGSDRITKAGATVGTVAYMSPEQVRGRDVDNRTDLFSLGVVLFELVTGRTPFKRENEAATLHAIVNEMPEPLSRFRSQVPDDLQRIVDKLLQKEPSLRYQTAADLQADLRRLATGHSSSGGAVSTSAKQMIAVLPFDNMGATEQDYFVDGITDEIASRLARIPELGVISHASALQYKKSDKRPRDIGRELGVGYILRGTVRWDSSSSTPRVRISAKLIRVQDETYSWAESFDRVLEQIFTLQSDIAEKVAEALGVAILGGAQRRSSASVATTNLEAYDCYLRANEFFPSMAVTEIRKAIGLYREAIAIDPNFASARARLAWAELSNYWFSDREKARLQRSKIELDAALELAPDHPDVRLAAGYYHYQGELDYEKALENFDAVLQVQPSNAHAIAAKAFVLRRQGRWLECSQMLRRAIELDPRSAVLSANQAVTFGFLRKYPEALRNIERAILLRPDFSDHFSSKAQVIFSQTGSYERAAEAFREGAERIDPVTIAHDIGILRAYVAYMGGDVQAAIDKLTLFDEDVVTHLFSKGELYGMLGKQEIMRAYFDSARAVLQRRLMSSPEDAAAYSDLGLAYAKIGDCEKAVESCKRATELLPISRDALDGMLALERMARVYMIVGDIDHAIDQYKIVLSKPCPMSREILANAPEFEPLRNHPRFAELMQIPDNPPD